MRVLITGSAGFIGFHLSKLLLSQGFIVHGFDGMTDYYDVNLKKHRQALLEEWPQYTSTKGMLEDIELLDTVASDFHPDVIVHLAAQAGVRYSLEHPRSYIESNITGTFNVMEISKKLAVKHLLMASTSSVYGANTQMPFFENEKADTPLTIYAATKKANEAMAHSYASLWEIPTTMFRFFTVYGPWGRPDMALFKFTKAMLNDEPIDVYNFGKMKRDFTYVDDLVKSIRLLIDVIPQTIKNRNIPLVDDSLSPVAPYRIVNIGNSKMVELLDFIVAIEKHLGIEAKKNMMPMQMGDVPATWADTKLLEELIGYCPDTNFEDGVKAFVDWYLKYYSDEVIQ